MNMYMAVNLNTTQHWQAWLLPHLICIQTSCWRAVKITKLGETCSATASCRFAAPEEVYVHAVGYACRAMA